MKRNAADGVFTKPSRFRIVYGNGHEADVIESATDSTTLNYTDFSFWLLWIGITVVYIVIRINIVSVPLFRDEGLWGYIGQVILDGGLPYRDAIEMKPPGAFYVYALALLFVPPTSAGIHVALHTYNFLTRIALYFFAKMYSRSTTTGLWVAFIYAVLSSSPGIQGYSATPEMFLLLPVTLSLTFAVLATSKDNLYLAIPSGVFAAFAFWTKQTVAPIILFIVLYLAITQIRNSKDKSYDLIKSIKSLVLWSFGFLLVSFLIVAYFYYHDIFDEFIYWSFTHAVFYTKRVKFTEILPTFLIAIKELIKGNLFIIVVGLVLNTVYLFRKNSRSYFVLGFFVFSLLATVPGYAYWHYFAQLVPALAIAGGFGVALLIEPIRNGRLKSLSSALCAAAIVLMPVFVHSGYYINKSPVEIIRRYFGVNPFPESIELAEFLANRTRSDDTIFIFGSEPQLLLYSQRKSAISFPMIYPLMSVYPRYREFQQKVWEEINIARPKYIVTVELPTSLAWDGEADLWLVKKTREIIAQSYYLEAVMTIDYPKGKLFILSKKDDVKEILNNHRVIMYILRSKLF